MESIVAGTLIFSPRSLSRRQFPCSRRIDASRSFSYASRSSRKGFNGGGIRVAKRFCVGALVANSAPSKSRLHNVGEFMIRKENMQVVKPTTSVDEALTTLMESKISCFPVIDDDWNLVGLVSDYDLLALDSIAGNGLQLSDGSLFPEVDSTWKVFHELQRLLGRTSGKFVEDVMSQAPVVVCEKTNLEDAARLLLETRYRRLPVVDADGKLVGIVTRGNVIRAALEIKRRGEKNDQ